MRMPNLTIAGATLGLALALASSEAMALTIGYISDEFGTEAYVDEDDDGDIDYVTIYNEKGEFVAQVDLSDGDPNPEGDGNSGLGPSKDDIMDALRRLGGAPYEATPEFWLTPIGRGLAESGIGGFNATDPPPEYDPGGLGYEHDEGFGGGGNGGFDPMGGGLKESIRQNAGKGNSGDDDDDDSDPPPTHQGEVFAGPPELVNPVPIARLNLRTVNVQPTIAVIGK